jgi:membrane associated rhomboid family serine protease
MTEHNPRPGTPDHASDPAQEPAARVKHPPMFNAPGVVVGLLGVLVAIHAGFALLEWLGQDERVTWWGWALAFVPARYYGVVEGIPGGKVSAIASFVTHTLLHHDLAHLFVNGGFLLAFGAMVARRIGALRFLALYLLSAIAGALLYLLINGNSDAVVLGASGAISGLLGAAFRFFFRSLEARHFGVSAEDASFVPRMTLTEMVTEPRVRTVIIVWLIVNFVVALVMPIAGGGGIAWEAHLGGFLFGLLTFGLFDPVRAAPTNNL